MPTSRSSPRNGRPAAPAPAPRSRLLFPLVLGIVAAVVVVVIAALPASLLRRFLPPDIGADGFSGTLWHGSAARVSLYSHDGGAVEWHLHPAALLTLSIAAEVHWVKLGFVADGRVTADRVGATIRDLRGGGRIEDLNELGIASGWRGASNFEFDEVKIAFGGGGGGGPILLAAAGHIDVSGFASPRIANGADLGSYALQIGGGSQPVQAHLNDTGGPLEVDAVITFSPGDHTGLLSGTIKERADAPAALRAQLDNLAQLHARDALGRLPVDLEFTL